MGQKVCRVYQETQEKQNRSNKNSSWKLGKDKMIKISDSAAKQIAISLEQMGDDVLPLRLAIKVQEDGSFHCNMGFDDNTHAGDKEFEEKNVKFVVDVASIALITGMTMDFVEINGKEEIVFLNPNDPSYKAPTED